VRPIKIVLHPDFTPGFIPGVSDPTLGAHGLAVLLFAPGTFAGVDPIHIVRRGRLDRLRAAGHRHGPAFTLVGYGTELRATAVSTPPDTARRLGCRSTRCSPTGC
jgi:hypothetical protein